MADTTVKLFHSGMPGAPVKTTGAGVLAALLDACLVNGFGLTSVSSLSIASNVATVVTTTTHSLDVGSVALIAGVTGGAAAVNGEQKVLSKTTYSYTFATTGISNQTASGTITSKNASLGWSTAFSDTNLRVYRPPAGSRFYMRLDDTGTTNLSRVMGYESMTDVNSGVGSFPTSTQSGDASGLLCSKRAGPWVLIGDDRGFYFCSNEAASVGFVTFYWGDLQPERSSDVYAVFSGGWPTDLTTGGSPAAGDLTAIASYQIGVFGYLARASTGLGSSQPAYAMGWPWPNQTWMFSGVNQPYVYPDPANNSLRLSQLKCSANSSIRATFPGIYPSYQSLGGTYGHLDRVDGQGALANRVVVAVRTGSPSGSTYSGGAIFFDMTGPWAR